MAECADRTGVPAARRWGVALSVVTLCAGMGCSTAEQAAVLSRSAPHARPARQPAKPAGVLAQVGHGIVCELSKGDVTCQDLCTGSSEHPVRDAVDLSYASIDACAILRGGDVACWIPKLFAPRITHPRKRAVHVYAGWGDECILWSDSSVTCYFGVWHPWEDPDSRNLHLHVRWPPSNPRGNNWGSAASGSFDVCFVAVDGRAWCAGQNKRGQAAPVAADWLPGATLVPLPGPATQVVMPFTFSCALLRDGQVFCWGDEATGRWAGGSLGAHAPPSPVPLPGPARALVHDFDGACALVGNDVYCWGGFTLPDGSVAHAPARALGDVQSLAAGRDTACAFLSNAKRYCWGRYQRRCGQAGTP